MITNNQLFTTGTSTGELTANYDDSGTLQIYNSGGVSNIQLTSQAESPSGHSWKVDKKRIGPRLYFKYVKSKFTKTEVKNLDKKLTALKSMLDDAEELGQVALFEELSNQIMLAVQQAELISCGYDKCINEKYIRKFMGICTEAKPTKVPSREELENERLSIIDYDNYKNSWGHDKIIYFKPLKEFPRKIPAKVKTIIKKVQKKNLFDEFMILYLDYTADSRKIKSNKEKIREKDPILFGRDRYRADNLYYITDWVDEVCDLTLDQIIEKEEGSVKQLLDINAEYVSKLKKEVLERNKRLKETKPSNYKELMEEEDKGWIKGNKKGFWKKVISAFRRKK